MKYKYTGLGLCTLLVFISIVSFMAPTGLFANAKPLEVHTQTLHDIVYRFLAVDEHQFLTTKNVQCQDLVKSALSSLLKIEPEQKESLGANEGFATIAFSAQYSVGTISMTKGAEFIKTNALNEIPAKVSFETERTIFADYSDSSRAIKIKAALDGVIEGTLFVIKKGSFQSGDVECGFG